MTIEDRIRRALSTPLTSDDTIDPARELQDVLTSVGLDSGDSGGAITFLGKDPIISSPWPLATMAAVSLMAKAVAFASVWKDRTGEGQDLSVDLRSVLHRLCPFYDRKWELLNGYPPGAPSDPVNPFMPSYMYQTRDERWIQLLNIYPTTKSRALALLGCNDSVTAVAAAVRKHDGLALEEHFNAAGLQATLVRTADEFLATEQFSYLKDMPLVEITKIGDSDPVPFRPSPRTPLDGIRATGVGHVIAGAG
ncbi:MAG: carnitine dehydratase, partial [Acetobacter aceti]